MVATGVGLGPQKWLLCLCWKVKDTQSAVYYRGSLKTTWKLCWLQGYDEDPNGCILARGVVCRAIRVL